MIVFNRKNLSIFIVLMGMLIPFIFVENRDIPSNNSHLNLIDQNKTERSKSDPSSPHSAASLLGFENNQIYFLVNEKGYLDNDWLSLWFDNYYHQYWNYLFLSIDDGQERSFVDFDVVETLHNLTTYDYPNHSIPLVAETLIKYPTKNVFVKIQYKLYPDDAYFITTFMCYSPTISNFRAELFYYMDLDIDGWDSSGTDLEDYTDDYAAFDVSTTSIYIYDPDTDHYLGWVSPIAPDDWEVGSPTSILSNIGKDTLNNAVVATNQDCSAATKYINASIPINQIWTVPIVFGFGTSLTEFRANSNAIKQEFIRDFSILNLIPNVSGVPEITVSVLNGGRFTSTRNVSVFRNNVYLTSQNVSLQAGEYISIVFPNLNLILGAINEIRVQVENFVQDYDKNDNLTQFVNYQRIFRVKVQDYAMQDLTNVNVSCYLRDSPTLVTWQQTNAIGNVTLPNLGVNNYTLVLTALWLQNKIITSLNISYPECGDFLTIQTNITTLILHIRDVEDTALNSIAVFIYRGSQNLIFTGFTDTTGNLTFRWLRGKYDIHMNFTYYSRTLQFTPIIDFTLNSLTYYTHSLPMTKINLHFKARSSQEPLVNAKIEFYNRTSDTNFGEYMGYEMAGGDGNISIVWDNKMNYSFRVIFYSEYKLIGDPESKAFNFTGTPFLTHLYAEINVTLQASLEEFTTGLVPLYILPLIYSWEDNISIQFLFNITGPSGSTGPQWANFTEVIIRDDDLHMVFNGSADRVISEVGSHIFNLNTTCGAFKAGNPAIYHMYINAYLIGYSPPSNPLDFSFKIYNISTSLTLKETAIEMFWNDNVSIQANYFDTIYDRPIVDGHVTVTWGYYLTDEPMYSLGNGSYTIQINSSIGSPTSYTIYINAEKPNHNAQEKRILMTIHEVPTVVNGSYIFDSVHNIYVTTENLSLQYYFLDEVREIPVEGISPSYKIIREETEEEYAGILKYNIAGFYELNPITSLFPIGNYHGVVQFYRQYYITSYATFRITVLPIPTTLNDTYIQSYPYNIDCYGDFRFKFTYRNSLDSTLISLASASYYIFNSELELNATRQLHEISTGIYEFNPNSVDLPIGTYVFNLAFEKMNYSSDGVSFTLIIHEISTSINGSGLSGVLQETYVLSSYSTVLNYSDFWGNQINQVNATYVISRDNSTWQKTGNLDLIGATFYRFLPGTEFFPIGRYFVQLEFQHVNYSDQIVRFILSVNEIPTLINGSELAVIPQEIFITTSFSALFNFRDYLGHPISEVNATYTIKKTFTSWTLDGLLTQTPIGLFLFDPNTANLTIGTYRCTLNFVHENYTDKEVSFSIVVMKIPMTYELYNYTPNNETVPITTNLTILRGDNIIIRLQLGDLFESPMNQCEILYTLSRENTVVQGEVINVGDGLYQIVFPKMMNVGVYTLNLVITAQNHADITNTLYIEVVWPRFLGVSIIYWFISLGFLLTVGLGLTTYVVIHDALIPPMVKKLNRLEKTVKRGQSQVPGGLITKDQVFLSRYGDRWNQLELHHPFVPVSPHIKAFIELFEENTGKSLLIDEAVKFLDDLSIYSQNEILSRLKAEGISDNRIFVALQIIESYIQENSPEKNEKSEHLIKEEDK